MEPSSAKPKASLLVIAKTVFWSFFGIRKRQDHVSDIVKLTPVQVILGGFVGALLFIATLLTVVYFVTR